jgi:hypothetical protein
MILKVLKRSKSSIERLRSADVKEVRI